MEAEDWCRFEIDDYNNQFFCQSCGVLIKHNTLGENASTGPGGLAKKAAQALEL